MMRDTHGRNVLQSRTSQRSNSGGKGRAERSQQKSERLYAGIMASRKRTEQRFQHYLGAFRRSGSGFRLWWLKLLGAMSTVACTIRNAGPQSRRRRFASVSGSPTSRFASINETLEPKLLLAANILGISPGSYTEIAGVTADTAVTNDNTPTLSGTKASGESVTLKYTDATAVVRTETSVHAGTTWNLELSNAILSGTTVTASVNGGVTPQDAVKITLDTVAPTKPTAVKVFAVGGTVLTNTLNFTNTSLTGIATITTGHAVGGKAELYIDGVLELIDNTISATDTSVTFTTSDGTPTALELQQAIEAGGVVTVNLTDAAGNESISSIANPTLAVDYLRPAVVINDLTGATTTNAPVTYTFTFSEAVVGFTSGDVSVTGGVKGALLKTSSTVYTMVVTPTANSETPITVKLLTNVVTDAAGNFNPASSTNTQSVDTKKPTLLITDTTPGVAIGDVTFTFTFSEPVNGFTVSDVVVTGGTKAVEFATGGDGEAVFTLVVTPTANSTTPITVGVAAGKVTDTVLPVGNQNTAALTVSQTVDTKLPTIVITDNKPGVTNGAVTFTFTFSEPVADFIKGDIAVDNGTPGTFTKVNSKVYTLIVTPDPNTTDNITVTVDANVATDAAGNGNLETLASQAFDTAAPTVDITSPLPGIATNAPVTYTFDFSEQVFGFLSSDVVVTGGTKGGLLPVVGHPTKYTMVVTPTTNSVAPIKLSLPANVVADAAGNGNTAMLAADQLVDTKKPSLVITDATPGVVNSLGTVAFSFTCSEDVTGFDTSDIVVTGGTKGIFDPVGPGAAYTLVVTPNANSTTPITVAVAAGKATDAAGNLNTAAVTVSQAVDTKLPIVVITDDKTGVTKGPVTFKFTFSEPVADFVKADVDVVDSGDDPTGIKGTFTKVSSTVYTLVFTPASDFDEDITVRLAADVATDAAGNGNLLTEAIQAIDTRAPAITIEDNIVADATNAPVTYTFDFDKPVIGFTTTDLVVTGGAKGSLVKVNDLQYTMVVTPLANFVGSISVTIPALSLTDVAGNSNAAASDDNQNVDTKKPTLLIADSTPGVIVKAGETATFTLTFSEDVTDFVETDIVVTGGVAVLTPGGGPTDFELVVTPLANSTTPIKVSVAAGAAVDLVGNLSTAAVSVSKAVDTIVPTVVITDNKSGVTNGPVTFTFTFSEPVNGFDDVVAASTILAGGTPGTFTQLSATVYTLVVNPDDESTTPITVQVVAGVVTDAAGNENADSDIAEQPVDTQLPALVITSDEGSDGSPINIANGTVTFTFTFTEPVTGFTSSDVAVTNGTKSGLSADGTGTVYTIVVTPLANFDGVLTVNIAGSVAADAAFNGNVAATEFTHLVNTVIPTVVITDNVEEILTQASGDVVFTFTFSEALATSLIDLEAAIILTNGTKGAFEKVSDTVYTLSVTPLENFVGTMEVRIDAGTFSNAALNLNSIFTEHFQSVNTF